MSLLVLWITTLAVCVAGAIIPLINTEIYLLSVSALSPRSFVVPLVVAATLGQMLGKVVMFYAGRGVIRFRSERIQRGIAAMRSRLERRPRTALLILFSSATFGLPPLYAVTVACGAVGMSLFSFFVVGTVGRLIHFAAVAALPQYFKTLLP